ncbi:MAG: hypothetical protein KAJ63_03400, partial [Methyloprofundus sp.]|nr:hypothetical protein [Methyloprofundus sp.]
MEQDNKTNNEIATETETETDIDTEISIDDIPYHSDKEMLIHVGIKFLLLFAIIFSFDFLIDFLLMILDLIFEILHLLIEIIEEMLESLLKEALPTTQHQNEVIIVNAAMIIVLFSLYKLFHGVRYLYRLKRHIKADWVIYKKRTSLGWKLLPFLSKV